MVVAKSNRRKRQDRVKAVAKHAEQARRRAKADREEQTAERSVPARSADQPC
jgi:hypothetical protein